jgi:hypothetical protein
MEEWLDQQVDAKKLNQKVDRAKSIINEKVKDAYHYLAEMEKASLVNPNIPERAKQVMEGNRKVYIQRIKRFLDDINVPDDYSQIGFCTAKVSEGITRLSEETQKNYMVLKEFMEAELTKVARAVKLIEAELSKLQSEIDREGLEKVKDAKIALKHYKYDLEKKAKLEDELALQKEELEALTEKKYKHEERLKDLEKSNDFAEYQALLEEKKQIEDSVTALKKELNSLFAELNRPLRKYKHGLLNEKLIDKYLMDPMGALEGDDSLVIVEVFGKMSQHLEDLDLKDNQLEKARELISKLNRDFLLNKRIELDRLRDTNKDTAGKINSRIAILNIAEAQALLKGVENNIAQLENIIEEINKKLSEVNLDYLKQKVKEKIKDISNVKVDDS